MPWIARALIGEVNPDKTWEEEEIVDSNDQAKAEEYWKKMVNEYNRTIQIDYGPAAKPRKFIKIVEIADRCNCDCEEVEEDEEEFGDDGEEIVDYPEDQSDPRD